MTHDSEDMARHFFIEHIKNITRETTVLASRQAPHPQDPGSALFVCPWPSPRTTVLRLDAIETPRPVTSFGL